MIKISRENFLLKTVDRFLGIPILFLGGILKKLRNKKLEINEIKNVLIVKSTAIGDTILLMYSLKMFKEAHPSIKITFICSFINESVVKLFPFIDSVITYKYQSIFNINYSIKTILKLRKTNFDYAICPSQWLRFDAIITMLSKSSVKIGFSTPNQFLHFAYDKIVPYDFYEHESKLFFELFRLINPLLKWNSEHYKPQIIFSDERNNDVLKAIENFKNEFTHIIIIQPFCGKDNYRSYREWGISNYFELINKIIKRYPECKILITGSKEEQSKEISLNWNSKVENCIGKFTLSEMARVFQKSDLLITGNNGLLHFASLFEIKIIELNGPVNHHKWSSLSKNTELIKSSASCSPCGKLGFEYRKCKAPYCMQHIKVDEVFMMVCKLLEENPMQNKN